MTDDNDNWHDDTRHAMRFLVVIATVALMCWSAMIAAAVIWWLA